MLAGLAEVRGVAGLPAAALAVAAPGVGDAPDGAVLGQHPQPVPAAAGPRPARPRDGPQPDCRPLAVRRPGQRQARRRGTGQRDLLDLAAQPGQQVHQRPDAQEAVRVRQRRRRRQVIPRVGFPGPLRQRAQHRRSRAGHQRPCQAHLHRQPRRDLPRPPPRHPGQRRIQQRRREHRRRQPQPRPLPHRPRLPADPGRRQALCRPRRLRRRRARQRPARHDPRARPGKLHQPPAGVLPDRRHRHHLSQPRLRIPNRPLPARRIRVRPRPGTGSPALARRDVIPGSG